MVAANPFKSKEKVDIADLDLNKIIEEEKTHNHGQDSTNGPALPGASELEKTTEAIRKNDMTTKEKSPFEKKPEVEEKLDLNKIIETKPRKETPEPKIESHPEGETKHTEFSKLPLPKLEYIDNSGVNPEEDHQPFTLPTSEYIEEPNDFSGNNVDLDIKSIPFSTKARRWFWKFRWIFIILIVLALAALVCFVVDRNLNQVEMNISSNGLRLTYDNNSYGEKVASELPVRVLAYNADAGSNGELIYYVDTIAKANPNGTIVIKWDIPRDQAYKRDTYNEFCILDEAKSDANVNDYCGGYGEPENAVSSTIGVSSNLAESFNRVSCAYFVPAHTNGIMAALSGWNKLGEEQEIGCVADDGGWGDDSYVNETSELFNISNGADDTTGSEPASINNYYSSTTHNIQNTYTTNNYVNMYDLANILNSDGTGGLKLDSNGKLAIVAPECSGTNKLQWTYEGENGKFICVPDVGTNVNTDNQQLSIASQPITGGTSYTASLTGDTPSSIQFVDTNTVYTALNGGITIDGTNHTIGINAPVCGADGYTNQQVLTWDNNSGAFQCVSGTDFSISAQGTAGSQNIGDNGTLNFNNGTGLTATRDGSNIAYGLNNTGVTAGQYVPSVSNSTTGTIVSRNISIPTFTVNSTGQLTLANTQAIMAISTDSSKGVTIDASGNLAITGLSSTGTNCAAGSGLTWTGSTFACTTPYTWGVSSGSCSTVNVAHGMAISFTSGSGLTISNTTSSGNQAINYAISLASGSGLQADINGLSLSKSCTVGQLLKWNGTAWACANDSGATYTAGTGIKMDGTIIENRLKMIEITSFNNISSWIPVGMIGGVMCSNTISIGPYSNAKILSTWVVNYLFSIMYIEEINSTSLRVCYNNSSGTWAIPGDYIPIVRAIYYDAS